MAIRGKLTRVRIHKSQFRNAVAQGLNSARVKEAAYRRAVELVTNVKKEAIREFDEHPVTKEISEGPSAANMSGTLSNGGNLFSYIGFYEGDDPTRIVRSYLNDKIKVFRQSRFLKFQTSGYYNFRVNQPIVSEIENLTPLPWERGVSWTRGIERGISGLGHYLHGRFSDSRSGAGIQSKYEVRPAIFRTKRYLTTIVTNFYKNIKNRRF